jgi:hypothetical protein
MVQLPSRFGGCGLSSAVATSAFAYHASLEQALTIPIHLPRAEYRKLLADSGIKSQKERCQDFYTQVFEGIKVRCAQAAAVLAETSTKSAGAMLRSVPLWTEPLNARSMGSILRLRTNSMMAALLGKTTCFACNTTVLPTQLPHHLAGCTLIKGLNSSAAHSIAKVELKKLFKHVHIQFDEAEPTN